MPVKCAAITQQVEKLAPKKLAEDWDNIGLLAGDPSADITGVLVTLDIDQSVVEEAISKGANLIISHHPFIFKPVKNILTATPSGALLQTILKHDINIYCAHTNLDIAYGGVNDVLADLLELKNVKVLLPTGEEKLYKLTVFVPKGYEDKVRDALATAGAGWIGNYSHCTYQIEGTGTFMPLEGTDPFIGEKGKLEKTEEYRLETIVPQKLLSKAVNAMIKAHPYEEVAYDIYPLANKGEVSGLGRVGELSTEVVLSDFIETVKKALGVDTVRAAGNPEQNIRKVAVCGGSGGKLVDRAIFTGAQVLLTGDVDYHQAQRAVDLGLTVIDAGHGATELPVVIWLAEYIRTQMGKNKMNVSVHVAETITDPWWQG